MEDQTKEVFKETVEVAKDKLVEGACVLVAEAVDISRAGLAGLKAGLEEAVNTYKQNRNK